MARRRGEIEFRCSPALLSPGSRWSRPSTEKSAKRLTSVSPELRYFGSQPWPFPRSLMVAFFARATATDIRADTDEIAHAEWCRDQLTAELDSRQLGLPGNSSIASPMIQAWRVGEAPL